MAASTAIRKTRSQHSLVMMLLFCVGIVVGESTDEGIVADGTGEGSNSKGVIETMRGDARSPQKSASITNDVEKRSGKEKRVDKLEKRVNKLEKTEREDLSTALNRAMKGMHYNTLKHSLCLDKTDDGKCCALPFTYKNKTYHSCTTVDRGTKLWCSLTPKHTHHWGNCQGLNGDKRCSFKWGDGIAESEVKIGNQKGVKCIDACIKKKRNEDNSINGVKVYSDIEKGGCWCQQKLTTMDVGNLKYKTCFLVILRCYGQNDGCCTAQTRCDVDEGDCDANNQCKQGLRCGTNNCEWGDGDDCCERIR